MLQVSAFDGHFLMLLVDGKVVAQGRNLSGQCDVPSHEVLKGRKATRVAAGYAHSLMLLDDGHVVAFGWNGKGQCNVPSAEHLLGRLATDVAAGTAHSLMLLDDGTLLAFGGNYDRQCGVPTADLLHGRSIKQVAAGGAHNLLLLDDGHVIAFGSNGSGQCEVPASVYLQGRKVTQVAAGGGHSLLLLDDGSIVAFGLNHQGQCSAPSAQVLQGRRVTQVAASGSASAVLLDDGSVLAFGVNDVGQCNVPSDSLKGRKATQVAAGRGYTLMILEDGNLFKFGFEAKEIDANALLGQRIGNTADCMNRRRHAAGIEEVLYKPIQDFVRTVKPKKKVTEHFQEEVPQAFPEIRPEFIKYYLETASTVAASRIEAGVTKDLLPMEVWAIVAYTMDSRGSGLAGAGASQNFYYQLNQCLLKRDMRVIKYIENYLHFLMRGLNRLASVQPDVAQDACCLYRGVSNTQLEIIRKKYKAGQTIHWPSITSVSLDEAVARQFACEDGPGGVVFEIWTWAARIIGDVSAIPTEREAVLLPNFKATVLEGLAQRAGEGTWVIKLIETRTVPTFEF